MDKFEDWLYDIEKKYPFVEKVHPYWFLCRTYNQIRSWVVAKYERIRYGYASVEAWDLYAHTAEYMLPRLKHLRKHHCGHPMSFKNDEEWNAVLDEMIWALEYVLSDYGIEFDDKKYKRAEKGLKLMGKHFLSLWD